MTVETPDTQPAAPGLTRKVAQGVIWTSLERWFARILSLVTFAVLARVLEPRQFGLVALAAAFVAIVNIIAEGGLATYIVQARTIDQRVLSSAFWTGLGLAALAAVALAGSAPLWAALLDEPRLTHIIWALCLTFLGTAASAAPGGLFPRALRFGPLAARQAIASSVASVTSVTLALLGAGVWALVAQAVATSLVGAAVLWYATTWRPALLYSRKEAGAALRFGSKLMSASLLTSAKDQGEFLIIGVVLGPASLGFWSVATRVLFILVELGVSVVSAVATPAFALMKGDNKRLARAYKRATSASAMVMLPMLVVLSTLSTDLIPLVFGEQWERSGELATVLTLMAVISVLINFDRSVYLAIGRPGVELALVAVVVVLHLTTVVVFAHWGLMALAVVILVRSALTWPVRVLTLRRIAGMTWDAYSGVGLAVASAGAAGIVMVALRTTVLPGRDPLPLAATALAGIAVYATGMFLISRDFRDLVRSLLRAVRARVARQSG